MKVLLVDDSPMAANLLDALMRGMGYDTEIAGNGVLGLSKLRQGTGIDFIISDVVMPGMNGLDFYRAVQQDPEFKRLPFVLTSNAADANMVRLALSLGCQHFLVKPLDPQKVSAVLRKIFPEQKSFIKERRLVLEEFGVGADAYRELLSAFHQQVAGLVDMIKAAPVDAPRPSREVNALWDGSQLLCTSQFQEEMRTAFSAEPYDGLRLCRILEVARMQLLQAIADNARPAGAGTPRADGLASGQSSVGAKGGDAARSEGEAASGGSFDAPVMRTETLYERLTAGAKSGDINQQFQLGMALVRGEGVPRNEREGIAWITQAASKRHPAALCALGLLKLEACTGAGTPEWDQAGQLLKAATSLNNGDAKYWLQQYQLGWENDAKTGVAGIAAAARGDVTAQYNLGLLYDRGSEVELNTPEAIYWLTRAAEQGHSPAQYRLALVYESGRGGDAQAYMLQWYEQAAEQGHQEAQVAVGRIYETGAVVKQDLKKASRWYELAANQGSSKAQYFLGSLCEASAVNDEGLIEAGKWLSLAANTGYTGAAKRLEQLRLRCNNYVQNRIAYEVTKFRKLPSAAATTLAPKA